MAGGAEFNRGKFKELVLHLAAASAEDVGFGMVKLNKLLYRVDFEAYRRRGRSITGATYEKQEFGPVARELLIALDDLGASGYIRWHQIAAGPYTRKVPEAKEPPDLSQFEDEDMAIIADALTDLAAYGGKSVSEWSHEQSAGWRAAEIGQEIGYGSALVSSAGLSDEQMDRALERSRDENWAAIRP